MTSQSRAADVGESPLGVYFQPGGASFVFPVSGRCKWPLGDAGCHWQAQSAGVCHWQAKSASAAPQVDETRES